MIINAESGQCETIYALLLQLCPKEALRCVGEIIKQCNGSYSPDSPLKVTILAAKWDFSLADSSLLSRQLAIQFAKFPQVQVTVLVPEDSCSKWQKREAASCGVTIVEAKKRPGFDDPVDWLHFPPQDLTTDIVIGAGERLSKIAQFFKERHQCKSIFIMSNPFEDWLFQRGHLRKRLDGNRTLGLSLETTVRHSEMAYLLVATEPKTYDEFSRRCHNKEVFKLTPGILREFYDVKHATADGTKFRILIFGSGELENFHVEGLDIAAEAIAELDDRSYQLLFVGAAEGKEEQFVERFHDYGVAKSQLQVRSLPKSEERLKRLFHEADLAIMPSGEQGFGVVALAALSAGLPILVHGDSGFGEALKEVTSGQSIVGSEDAKEWAKKIKGVKETPRKTRLEEAAILRSSYDKMYSWEKQCGELVKMMLSMVSGMQNFDSCNCI